jgi:hypothetical protein
LKIDPTYLTLGCLAGLAWGGVAMIVATKSENSHALAAAIGIGVTAVLCGVARWGVAKVVEVVTEHADRMDKATREHAETMQRRVLNIEKFFALGQQSDLQARACACHDGGIRDTGSFQLSKGDFS